MQLDVELLFILESLTHNTLNLLRVSLHIWCLFCIWWKLKGYKDKQRDILF